MTTADYEMRQRIRSATAELLGVPSAVQTLRDHMRSAIPNGVVNENGNPPSSVNPVEQTAAQMKAVQGASHALESAWGNKSWTGLSGDAYAAVIAGSLYRIAGDAFTTGADPGITREFVLSFGAISSEAMTKAASLPMGILGSTGLS